MWRGALYDVGESVELELHVDEGRGERGGRERACSAIGGASARVELGRQPRRLGVDHGAAEAVTAARRACTGEEGVAEHDGDDLQEGGRSGSVLARAGGRLHSLESVLATGSTERDGAIGREARKTHHKVDPAERLERVEGVAVGRVVVAAVERAAERRSEGGRAGEPVRGRDRQLLSRTGLAPVQQADEVGDERRRLATPAARSSLKPSERDAPEDPGEEEPRDVRRDREEERRRRLEEAEEVEEEGPQAGEQEEPDAVAAGA